MNKRKGLTSSSFERLPDPEKERIYGELHREDPWEQIARSKPLTASQQSLVAKATRKGGRPMLGKLGVKVIAVSVERNLLKRADTYGESLGLKRSELISKALNKIIPKAGQRNTTS